MADELFVEPSKIEAYPKIIEYQHGETIVFTCHLSGFKYAKWTGVSLHDETSRIKKSEQISKNGNDIMLSMVIENSSKYDEGVYECKGFRSSNDYEIGSTL